tara:strand:- start:1498 stop:2187 length:690 start_codon:yes stop_codon:yes gene_type:complete
LKSRVSSIKQNLERHFAIKGVEVIVKDPLPKNINPRETILKSLSMVPEFLLRNLDVIYIGRFKDLEDRNLQAMYQNSSVFLTNKHVTPEGMIDDLIHEIAHSVEETYKSFIYSDLKIENEFLQKRKSLWSILKSEGFTMELSSYLNVDYDKNFDQFLYSEVGYPMLSIFSANLFYSPYAATSIREYFANGFEAFFMREDLPRLKRNSPILFKKIVSLMNLEKEEKSNDF